MFGSESSFFPNDSKNLGPNGKDDVNDSATHADHQVPSTVKLPEPESQPGAFLPNGEINWDCPCLGGMATGPCGVEFKSFFSCLLNPKATDTDCFELFESTESCLRKFPTVYKNVLDHNDDLNESLAASEHANMEEKLKTQ